MELVLRLFVRKAERFEHLCLQFGIEDTDRPSADFHAVDDEVVGVGPDFSRIGVEQADVFGIRRRERVVHRVETLRLVVPFEQREIDYPQRRELLVRPQSQPIAHFEA